MELSTVFKWRIDNFSQAAARNGSVPTLRSPAFELKNGSVFYLRFDPITKQVRVNRNYCSLFLVAKNLSGHGSVTLEFCMWAENNVGERSAHHIKVVTEKFDLLDSWGMPKFMKHRRLYGPDSSFIKDDVVVICCEIKTAKPHQRLPSFEEQLVEKMYSFCDRASTESCVIRVGDRDFNVSKAVLMSRSAVFNRLFNLDTKGAQISEITIKDFSPELMGLFIKYLYFGKLENLAEMAKELFILADKYEVKSLKEECAHSLSDGFNKENVVDRLLLAFTHGDDILKKAVLAYVCDTNSAGNFDYIKTTDEWKKLVAKNEKLAKEIENAIVENLY